MILSGDETIIQRSSYSLAGQRIATRVSSTPPGSDDGLFFVYSDHLGSTSMLVNSSDQPVSGSSTRYLPFGGYRTTPTQTITDRQYTGHAHNGYIKLVYMNSRWYAPEIGRFLSADPIIPDPTNPQSYNRYSYVYNNPLVYVDKDGHLPVIPVLIGAGIVALKVIDYGWTAWDVYQAGRTLANPGASQMDRMMAGLTVGLAVLFEAVEPDDILPVGLPIDDVARRAVLRGAQEALQEGGEASVKRFLRNSLGDKADEVIDLMRSRGVLQGSPRGLQGEAFENWIAREFGGPGAFHAGGRQFDGAIGNTWIEAKSGWNFVNNPADWHHFQSTTGQKRQIAQSQGKGFAIYSNVAIPDHVKAWLRSKGIDFIELLD